MGNNASAVAVFLAENGGRVGLVILAVWCVRQGLSKARVGWNSTSDASDMS